MTERRTVKSRRAKSEGSLVRPENAGAKNTEGTLPGKNAEWRRFGEH